MSEETTIEAVRTSALRRIEENRLAGQDTRHNRNANLQAVQQLVDNDIHYTWNIAGTERFTFDETLEAISAITGCSNDPKVTTGGGYISPQSTLKALEAAAHRIHDVASTGGTFLLGTGHPGSLLMFYLELSRLIRDWGGVVATPVAGQAVPPNLEIGYVEGLAVTTDRASLMHSHGHQAMDAMLQAGHVDLVIADHGYAGAAINAGTPVIAIMDTNDPALAVAHQLGADLLIIPMDDNRPLDAYPPIVQSIRELGEAAAGGTAPAAEPYQHLQPEEVSDALRQTEAYERMLPSQEGLDELVRGFLKGYIDQTSQSAREAETGKGLEDEPLWDLALLGRIHEAVAQAITNQLSGKVDEGVVSAYLSSRQMAPGPRR